MIQSSDGELARLIFMAEDVSGSVNDLHAKLTQLKTLAISSTIGIISTVAILYMMVTWPSKPFEVGMNVQFISACICSLGFSCFSFYTYHMIIRIKECLRNISIENEILRRLLDLVYEYKDHIYDEDLSYIERTMLDLRLQRVKFSIRQK